VLYSCAFFCARVVSRFAPVLLFTPGAVWGALGGRRPLLGGPGDTPPVGTFSFVVAPVRGLFPPLFKGGLGGL